MAERKPKAGPGTRLQDVARACRVSLMTASRALRNDSVAPETRRRVLATAERLGYEFRVRQGRPRHAAGRARPTVDVIVGTAVSAHGLFYSSLLVGLERALERQGRDCVIRTCGAAYEEFVSLLKAVQSSTADGILIAGYLPTRQIAALLACHPRTLLVDHTGDPALATRHASVAVDYVDAARQGLRHLLGLGRRRIALLMGPPDHYFSRDSAQGYAEMLAQAGVTGDPSRQLRANFTAESARVAVRDALAARVRFDALFTNDEMALGALRALHDAGLSVPGDVAIVGCDGLPVGLCSIPSLTTLRIDVPALAETAVSHLLKPPSGAGGHRHIRLCAELEIRESA